MWLSHSKVSKMFPFASIIKLELFMRPTRPSPNSSRTIFLLLLYTSSTRLLTFPKTHHPSYPSSSLTFYIIEANSPHLWLCSILQFYFFHSTSNHLKFSYLFISLQLDCELHNFRGLYLFCSLLSSKHLVGNK